LLLVSLLMKLSYQWLKALGIKISSEKMAEILDSHLAETEVKKLPDSNDTIFEIENVALTQRPDLFSHQGIAREIKAVLGQTSPSSRAELTTGLRKQIKQKLTVTVEDPDLCLRYLAVKIEGVKMGPSPFWMQKRLKNLGLRPINNVVDITNYILLETGQPLHAFDANKLEGKSIVVRKAKKGEKIKALDGREYKLDENDLVIADHKKPVALAGIIGGEESGVTESTKTVVIESANFEPINIRKTSKRLNLSTEASIRFEKGLPVSFAQIGLNRALELIKKIAKGKVTSEILDILSPLAQARLIKRKKILINLEKINQIIGEHLGEKEIINFLKKLGFAIKKIDPIKKLVKLVIAQKGKPYKYGASTFIEAPDVFDCSSLVRWLYREIGIELPRISIEQADYGEEVEKNNFKPGDLIFKKNKKPHLSKKFPQGIGHVGIVLNKGKIIHALGSQKKVVVESLKTFLSQDFVVAKRIIKNKTGLLITVPDFRPDIKASEDLVEEIVRLSGIERVSPYPIKGLIKPGRASEIFLLKREIKNILNGLGFDEIYSYSFYGEEWVKDKAKYLEILNPLNQEQRYLRKSLLPGLIKNYKKNLSLFENFRIFEIGKVFSFDKEVKQEDHLAGLIYQKGEQYWSVKGVIETFLEKIGLAKEKINYQLGNNDSIVRQKTIVFYEKEIIGFLGLAEDNLSVFEFDLEKLISLPKKEKVFKPISPYPAVIRDLAFLFGKDIKWQDVYQRIKEINPLIVKIEIFDVFESEKFEGRKNIAFHIIYQSMTKTLISEEVEEIQKKIITIIEKDFKGQLRTF